MKRLNIFLVLALTLLASCVQDDVYVNTGSGAKPTQSGIKIFGLPEDYDVKNVGTRADGEISDSHISEMTMFVFKANGDIVQGYSKRSNETFDTNDKLTGADYDPADKCSSAINIQAGNPTFLIDTEDGLFASLEGDTQKLIYYDNFAEGLENCRIYIVANAYHQLEGQLDNINTLEDLKAVVLDVDETLTMPLNENGAYRGFPMIGTHNNKKKDSDELVTFNLHSGGTNEHSVASIPLKKLYSKVCFTMQVKANQVVSGQTPKFEIDKVEVFNVPNKVRMGRELTSEDGLPIYGTTADDDYLTEMGVTGSYDVSDYYHHTGIEPYVIDDFNQTIIYHHDSEDQTDDIIKFHFYMPEHKVTPNEITYPTGMDPNDENLKQYYKPKGVGATRNEDGTTNASKVATYARIHGTYTDHNGQIKTVRYDIYLGQNAYNDFTVKRNQQLNNKLVIMGLTNYYDAYGDSGDDPTDDNISIDHRVDVDYTGFNLSMERTAILDAHFEVRPLDIELSPGGSMTITIPETYRSWVAMESDQWVRDNYNADTYVSNEEHKAVRKYFTTNLVSDINGVNGGTVTVSHSGADPNKSELHRIWFYIDENPNVYDKTGTGAQTGESGYTVNTEKYRICPVEFSYTGTTTDKDGNDITVTKTTTINFQQWNLWRVWNATGTRYYDIEHEEEYLNNYDAEDDYGQTKDEGMVWGLDGVQLSKEHNSFYIDEDNEEWNNYVENTSLLKYDFYIGKYDGFVSDGVMVHGYAGQHFTNEIFENSNGAVKSLTMAEQPSGAVEYCYNRNKRNADGSIAAVEWYLPSADELEDFIVTAYASFKEFQDNYYWTSQPAYIRNAFYYEYATGGSRGVDVRDAYAFVAYEDNKNYARATKVVAKGNDVFDYALSGLNKIPTDAHAMDDNCISQNAQLLDGSYFNVMYSWYRWNGGTTTITFTADEHFNAKKDGNSTGVRYHIHVGHSFDKMYQVDENGDHGYHPRTKKNRVRCVRRDWNPNNNYEAEIVYTVSTTPATELDISGGTMYVMRNTNYSSTQLTTSGTNLAASNVL